MTLLVLGLLIFLGVHSVRIVADGWRTRTRASLGEGPWKGLFSVLSLAGLVAIVWGYGLARQAPVALWAPQTWPRHLAGVLTLAAFVLLAAAYVPGNALKARLHHPMLLGVKLWALAHLLANHTLADVVLFGSFLVWAVLDFRSARSRDRTAGTVVAPGRVLPTVVSVVVGVAAWLAFVLWAHAAWIGVRPFG